MERFLLNIYIFFILVSIVFVGHEGLLRILVAGWMCTMIYTLVQSRKKGALFSKSLAIYIVYFLPAFVSSGAALYAKLTGNNNEWANGVLEIWIHPFLSVLELLPLKFVWGMSSLFLLSCLVPIALILIHSAVCLVIRPEKNLKKKALDAP